MVTGAWKAFGASRTHGTKLAWDIRKTIYRVGLQDELLCIQRELLSIVLKKARSAQVYGLNTLSNVDLIL